MLPEARARERIDALLRASGWVLQDRDEVNLGAGLGVAVREFRLPAGPCDYLLFVDRKAAGVIEAKPEGVTLTGAAEQADAYMAALPAHVQSWAPTLLFDYESTGTETLFRDLRDPEPRSRRVFAFHKPETLFETLTKGSSLRARLRALPPLDRFGLRQCQIEAIEGLERSLKQGDPRALVQMATGAGKTFTACNEVYRLLAHAGAKRILFLVDRKNLGTQTKNEFQRFQPAGTGRLFTELYNVQLLSGRHIETSSAVVISTIQRLYASLRGEELDEELDEKSAFELSPAEVERPVVYNPEIPIETFDVVIVDECHRSIYGVWRQVLEYFDAFVIGLTATPSKHTLGYFNQNLVAEYPYERSVADGVNVGYEIFRIRTKIGEHGSKIEAGYAVPARDRRTRRVRYQQLEDDLPYTKEDLDRSVLAPNQIHTVLTAYRDALPTQLFPGRTEVPKTLIFAKDDHHAEEIVTIAREVFGKGNEFAKKITYRVTGASPAELIKEFQTAYNPRIAVTVDMIATGTDIKPLEVVMFLRDVKSELYYEQMKGIGDDKSPIIRADALLTKPSRNWDYVLTNPPFGRKQSFKVFTDEGDIENEREDYERPDFRVTTSNKQLNFLQHAMSILEENGTAAIVLPDNVLFEAGAGEKIRKRLLDDFDFHTLLRLPTGIFYKPGVKANVLFFDKRPAAAEPWTKEVWVYDFRTNQNFTLKERPLKRAHLDDFVAVARLADRHRRKETERFRRFAYADLVKRDKLNLDFFWLKDSSFDDPDNLPPPDEIAAEIVESLEAALARFRNVAAKLG